MITMAGLNQDAEVLAGEVFDTALTDDCFVLRTMLTSLLLQALRDHGAMQGRPVPGFGDYTREGDHENAAKWLRTMLVFVRDSRLTTGPHAPLGRKPRKLKGEQELPLEGVMGC